MGAGSPGREIVAKTAVASNSRLRRAPKKAEVGNKAAAPTRRRSDVSATRRTCLSAFPKHVEVLRENSH